MAAFKEIVVIITRSYTYLLSSAALTLYSSKVNLKYMNDVSDFLEINT